MTSHTFNKPEESFFPSLLIQTLEKCHNDLWKEQLKTDST